LLHTLKTRLMRTQQILNIINDWNGFDNFNKWNFKEITEYILINFDCSKFVAKNVAYKLV